MEEPLVSIVMNNYNYGRFLEAALDSALAQTYSNVEVIVVDDGSTDNSRAILATYGEQVCAVLKENGGQASAFNAGFAASRGEIIMFLDSDDIVVPDRAARVVAMFLENPDIGWCFNRIGYFRDGDPVSQYTLTPLPSGVSFGRWDVRSLVLHKGYAPYIPAPTSALAFRRSLLSKILPMPVASRVRVSDNYIKFVAVGMSPGVLSPEELSLQRLHGNNAYTTQCGGSRGFAGAQVSLTTGFHLLKQQPVMRKMAMRMLAIGIALSWVYHAIDEEYWCLLRQSLGLLTFSERFWLLTFTVRELIFGIKRAYLDDGIA